MEIDTEKLTLIEVMDETGVVLFDMGVSVHLEVQSEGQVLSVILVHDKPVAEIEWMNQIARGARDRMREATLKGIGKRPSDD